MFSQCLLLCGPRCAARRRAVREALADRKPEPEGARSELGDALDALDVNPLACAPSGVVAVDALVVPRLRSGGRMRRD